MLSSVHQLTKQQFTEGAYLDQERCDAEGKLIAGQNIIKALLGIIHHLPKHSP